MTSIADLVAKFLEGKANGSVKSVKVPASDFDQFIIELARHGFRFANAVLDELDPEAKRIVKTILYSTSAGAVVGGVIGFAVTRTPAGAQAGAAIGAGIGLIAGAAAVAITVTKNDTGFVFE